MGKKYKVKKDYGSGYRSSYYGFRKDFPDGSRRGRFRKSTSHMERGKKIGKILLLALGFAAVVAIAFFVTDFALNLSNQPVVTDNPSQTDTGAQQAGTQQTPQQTEPAQQTLGVAVWLPADTFRSDSALEPFLANVKQLGATTVLLEGKNLEGELLFPTSLEQAATIGAAESAYADFAQAVEKIRANGLKVMIQLQCFRDPLAARRLGEGSAVYYERPGTLWLDNSLDQGGKPWANPYSETVQNYLTGLIGELAAMEIDGIVLDSVQFPSGYALNRTYYTGESESGVSRNEVLKNFVAAAKNAAGEVELLLMQSGAGALGGDEEQYHGSLFGSGADGYLPDFRLSGLERGVTAGEEVFNAADPAAFLTAAGEQLKAAVGGATLMPVLEAGVSLSVQVNALQQAGLENYLVYSANGSYSALQ